MLLGTSRNVISPLPGGQISFVGVQKHVDILALDNLLPLLFVMQFVDVGTMVSPTVFARRSLAYLLTDQAEAALRDAMQAQYVHPEWPTAFYMQAAALAKLGMETDAHDMLREGASLDIRKTTGVS